MPFDQPADVVLNPLELGLVQVHQHELRFVQAGGGQHVVEQRGAEYDAPGADQCDLGHGQSPSLRTSSFLGNSSAAILAAKSRQVKQLRLASTASGGARCEPRITRDASVPRMPVNFASDHLAYSPAKVGRCEPTSEDMY